MKIWNENVWKKEQFEAIYIFYKNNNNDNNNSNNNRIWSCYFTVWNHILKKYKLEH